VVVASFKKPMSNCYIWNPSQKFSDCETFCFSGARKKISWPKNNGSLLGAVGVWNFLLRIGIHAEFITEKKISLLPQDGRLFVVLDAPLVDIGIIRQLRKLVEDDYQVIASGSPGVWMVLLPELFKGKTDKFDNPYAALAYGFEGEPAEIIAPPLWNFFTFHENPVSGIKQLGCLLAIQGERQTPSRALLFKHSQSPAIIQKDNFIYLNGSPFHSFQAWLQGQEDLNPWLQWRHRLFWLDEMAAYLRFLLVETGVLPKSLQTILAPELGETCIVLRHDLDGSRDASYLKAEEHYGIPGVHGVLRDSNAKFWVKILNQFPKHESAFHYNTGRYSRKHNWIRQKLGLSSLSYRPDRRDVKGNGLYKQVQ